MENYEDRCPDIKYEMKSTKEKEVVVYIETGTDKTLKSRNQCSSRGTTTHLTQATCVS